MKFKQKCQQYDQCFQYDYLSISCDYAISHKNSETNTPPPVSIMCGDVTAFGLTVFVIQGACTSDTTIGIYFTISNVLKILTGFDQVSLYFVTDCHKIR